MPRPIEARPLARAVACVAAAFALASCAHMDPAPAPVQPVDLAAHSAKPGTVDWPREDWWRRYGDEQLSSLVTEGLAGSPSLAAARARVARADAAAGAARSALSPQVNGSASVLYQRFSENYIFPPPFAGSWEADSRLSLDFTHEFDFWNRNGAALQAALSQAQAAAADAQATRVLLTAGIATAYFDLQRLFAQREVSLAAIAQREDIVRLTTKRRSAGLDNRIAVKQAEATLAAARTELAQEDDDIAIARHRIAALVGRGPERGDAIVAVPGSGVPAIELPSALPLDLVSRRPDIVASRWRVEAAGHEVEVAKATFYPNVNLVALVGFNSIGLAKLLEAGSLAPGIGPAIHLPIFDGGRLNADLLGRRAERDLAVSAYNQAVIDAARDVADALSSIRLLSRVAAEQAQAREATAAAYDLAVLRYKAGLGNYLTVLVAQTQRLAQERLDADLKARAFELDVSLARALGGGAPDVPPPGGPVAVAGQGERHARISKETR